VRQIPGNVFVLCLLLILSRGRALAQPTPPDTANGQIAVAPPVSAVPAGEPGQAEASGGTEGWSHGNWASRIWLGRLLPSQAAASANNESG
jgi:hypothetical protein